MLGKISLLNEEGKAECLSRRKHSRKSAPDYKNGFTKCSILQQRINILLIALWTDNQIFIQIKTRHTEISIKIHPVHEINTQNNISEPEYLLRSLHT